jgi:hypothetical protein
MPGRKPLRLARENKSKTDKSENGNNPKAESDPSKSTTPSSGEERQQNQKAEVGSSDFREIQK